MKPGVQEGHRRGPAPGMGSVLERPRLTRRALPLLRLAKLFQIQENIAQRYSYVNERVRRLRRVDDKRYEPE